MDKLYQSRKQQYFQQKTQKKLQSLSPQKYGKGAFADLTYTPYKLADNVLYRQAVTLKKYEDGTNKLRQLDAQNSFLKDKIKSLQKQKKGIQESLIHQIKMYKQMLNDLEKSHQGRIKDIQRNFKQQVHKLILEKQTQAKFWQSQKEALQRRIQELQESNRQLQFQLSNRGSEFQNMIKQNDQLKEKIEQIKDKIKQSEQKAKQIENQTKQDIKQMKQMMLESQDMWRMKLDKLLHQKNLEIQDIGKIHRTELQYMDRKRQDQIKLKNEQIKDLLRTFDDQSNRMNDIINARDKQIEIMAEEKVKGKSVMMDLTKNYETEISSLVHEKRKYMQQCELLRRQIEALSLMGPNNPKIAQLTSQNELLIRQVRNLKEVLYESSDQMQKCRQQFLRMGKQKDQILLQMKSLKLQKDSLQRMNRDRSQQADNWKISYYRQKKY